MNRLSSLRISTLVLLVLMGLGVSACGGGACEELGTDVCPYCTDTTYRESCERLVAEELEDVCATQKSTFQLACPPPQ